MHSNRDSHDFGTLFSTLGAFASPIHETVSRTRLYDAIPELRLRSGPRRTVRRALEMLVAWHERSRQRRSLAELDDHLLRDLGISRAEATMEVDKPFWRV